MAKEGKKKKEKAGKAEKSKAPKASSKEGQTSYVGSIALSKLQHVIMTKKGKKGKVTGLFIPIKANYLVEGKEGAVYLPLRVFAKEEEDQYGQHGFISQSVGSETYKAASEKQKDKFKQLPILGNIKNFAASSPSSNDSSGSMGKVDEEDDLPF